MGRDTLDPILFLLSSLDTEVQRAASAALGNLAVNSALSMLSPSPCRPPHLRSIAENKLLIVKLGGLEPLIRQMLSPNVEVQCNAVGCVTNLATHGTSSYLPPLMKLAAQTAPDDNKTKIAKSGALVPLTRLARSKDMRVQRNATGALLNMTHSGTCSSTAHEKCLTSCSRREQAAACECRCNSCARQSSQLPGYGCPILLHNCAQQHCGRWYAASYTILVDD